MVAELTKAFLVFSLVFVGLGSLTQYFTSQMVSQELHIQNLRLEILKTKLLFMIDRKNLNEEELKEIKDNYLRTTLYIPMKTRLFGYFTCHFLIFNPLLLSDDFLYLWEKKKQMSK